MATTYSLMKGGTSGYPAVKNSGVYKLEYKLDIAQAILDGDITTGIVQNDVIKAIEVPANTYVLGVGYQVTTSLTSTGTTTMEVGDGDDTDGYIAAASIMTAAATQVSSVIAAITVASPSTLPNNSEAFTFGKFYTAADTIDLKFPASATATVGVVKVWVLLVDCNLTV
jgi:hypothetical protein